VKEKRIFIHETRCKRDHYRFHVVVHFIDGYAYRMLMVVEPTQFRYATFSYFLGTHSDANIDVQAPKSPLESVYEWKMKDPPPLNRWECLVGFMKHLAGKYWITCTDPGLLFNRGSWSIVK
jgi:hypothetical protein